MYGSQSNFSRLLFGTHPDCASASDQGKRIVANNFRRPFDAELDCIVSKRTYCVEFIGDAQNYASSIGAIGDQSCVIGHEFKFLINSFAGIALRNHQLAADIAFEFQVPPLMKKLIQRNDEGRVAKMRELFSVGIGLGY